MYFTKGISIYFGTRAICITYNYRFWLRLSFSRKPITFGRLNWPVATPKGLPW